MGQGPVYAVPVYRLEFSDRCDASVKFLALPLKYYNKIITFGTPSARLVTLPWVPPADFFAPPHTSVMG